MEAADSCTANTDDMSACIAKAPFCAYCIRVINDTTTTVGECVSVLPPESASIAPPLPPVSIGGCFSVVFGNITVTYGNESLGNASVQASSWTRGGGDPNQHDNTMVSPTAFQVTLPILAFALVWMFLVLCWSRFLMRMRCPRTSMVAYWTIAIAITMFLALFTWIWIDTQPEAFLHSSIPAMRTRALLIYIWGLFVILLTIVPTTYCCRRRTELFLYRNCRFCSPPRRGSVYPVPLTYMVMTPPIASGSAGVPNFIPSPYYSPRSHLCAADDHTAATTPMSTLSTPLPSPQ